MKEGALVAKYAENPAPDWELKVPAGYRKATVWEWAMACFGRARAAVTYHEEGR